jgi:hypothetical protein
MRHCLQRNADLVAVVIGASLILFLLAVKRGISFDYFVIDTFALGKVPPYAGLVSNAGVGCWVAGGVIALFSSLVLLRTGVRTETVLCLRTAGLFSLWLGMDDFFMLHDWLLPRLLPVRERDIILLNVAVGIVFLVRYHRALWDTRREAVLLSGVLFALSVVLDFVHDVRGLEMEALLGRSFAYLLEDGSKFLGICVWGYFLIRESASQVLRYLRACPVCLTGAGRGERLERVSVS